MDILIDLEMDVKDKVLEASEKVAAPKPKLKTPKPKTRVEKNIQGYTKASGTIVSPHSKELSVNIKMDGTGHKGPKGITPLENDKIQSFNNIEGKFTINEDQVKSFTKDSKLKQLSHHTMATDRVEDNMKNGFRVHGTNTTGKEWGLGVYTSLDSGSREHYFEGISSTYHSQGRTATEVTVAADVRKPLEFHTEDIPLGTRTAEERCGAIIDKAHEDNPGLDVQGKYKGELNKIGKQHAKGFDQVVKKFPPGSNYKDNPVTKEARSKMIRDLGLNQHQEVVAMTNTLTSMGYDSLILHEGGKPTQLVAFNPQKSLRIVKANKTSQLPASHGTTTHGGGSTPPPSKPQGMSKADLMARLMSRTQSNTPHKGK